MNTKREVVYALIKRALDNDLTKEEYHDFIANMEEDDDSVINEAAHAVGHFLVDIDVLTIDTEYSNVRQQELRDFMKMLK